MLHNTCPYCGLSRTLDPSASYWSVCSCDKAHEERVRQDRERRERIKKQTGGRRRRDRGIK